MGTFAGVWSGITVAVLLGFVGIVIGWEFLREWF
jgi:hypothetical protein